MLNKSGPIRVRPPNLAHLINWDALSFRQEEVDENCHQEHKEAEEDEHAELQVPKHHQENLRHQESEDHVHRYGDTLGY